MAGLQLSGVSSGRILPPSCGASLELGVPRTVGGLPPSIGPGSYIVRARVAAVSDDRAVGLAPAESTIASCQTELHARGPDLLAASIEVSVVFRATSCELHAIESEVMT